MPSQQNIELLQTVSDKVAKSKSIVLVEYTGLSVKDQTKLRAALKAAGGELNVVKNRIVKLALSKRFTDGLPGGLEEALQGASAIIFGFDDAVAAVKALTDFAKTHETLKAKVGVLMADGAAADRVLSVADVDALAKLPGRQELLTMVVVRFMSPIQGFHNVLQGNLSGLARVLNAIKEKRST